MKTGKHLLTLALSFAMLLTALPAASASAAVPPFGSVETTGTASNNEALTNTLKRSFLTPDQDGGVTRVEALEDSVCVEHYDKNLALASTLLLDYPLPLFGGYYAGETGNYLAFGQANPEESDEVEVLRIQKYDQDWNYVAGTSYFGCNTQTPFAAGTLRMTEMDGKLYVLTCHRMYTSEDGLNHQANMGFVIDAATMKSESARYDVSNPMRPTEIGRYCSHSFNQFITNDGTELYTADLGDAYPRSVMVTRGNIAFDALTIKGNIGNNYTGVTLGGMQVTDSTLIVAGASIDQSEDATEKAQNIFISTTDKTTMNTTLTWLTDYTENHEEGVIGTPYLIPMPNQQSMLLWERASSYGSSVSYVLLDQYGKPCYEPRNYSYMNLSDCAPIYWNNMVIWYTASDNSPDFTMLLFPYDSPYDPPLISALIGDADGNDIVDVSDMVLLARFVAEDPDLAQPIVNENADSNQDGLVNADDINEIARYLAKLPTEYVGHSIERDAYPQPPA